MPFMGRESNILKRIQELREKEKLRESLKYGPTQQQDWNAPAELATSQVPELTPQDILEGKPLVSEPTPVEAPMSIGTPAPLPTPTDIPSVQPTVQDEVTTTQSAPMEPLQPLQVPETQDKSMDILQQIRELKSKSAEDISDAERQNLIFKGLDTLAQGMKEYGTAKGGAGVTQLKATPSGKEFETIGQQQIDETKRAAKAEENKLNMMMKEEQLKKELRGLNPRSVESQMARANFKKILGDKYGSLIGENMSAKEIGKYMGPIMQRIKYDSAQEAKQAQNKVKAAQKEAAKLTKWRVKDEKTLRDVMKTSTLGGRGGQKVVGNAIMKQRAIMDFLDSTKAILDDKDFVPNKQVATEFASMMATVLKGGGGTPGQEEIRELVPQSVKGDVASMIEYISARPQEYMSKDQIKQFVHIMERENKFWSDKIKGIDRNLSFQLEPIFNRKDKGGYFVNKDLLDTWGRYIDSKQAEMVRETGQAQPQGMQLDPELQAQTPQTKRFRDKKTGKIYTAETDADGKPIKFLGWE